MQLWWLVNLLSAGIPEKDGGRVLFKQQNQKKVKSYMRFSLENFKKKKSSFNQVDLAQ